MVLKAVVVGFGIRVGLSSSYISESDPVIQEK